MNCLQNKKKLFGGESVRVVLETYLKKKKLLKKEKKNPARCFTQLEGFQSSFKYHSLEIKKKSGTIFQQSAQWGTGLLPPRIYHRLPLEN